MISFILIKKAYIIDDEYLCKNKLKATSIYYVFQIACDAIANIIVFA